MMMHRTSPWSIADSGSGSVVVVVVVVPQLLVTNILTPCPLFMTIHRWGGDRLVPSSSSSSSSSSKRPWITAIMAVCRLPFPSCTMGPSLIPGMRPSRRISRASALSTSRKTESVVNADAPSSTLADHSEPKLSRPHIWS